MLIHRPFSRFTFATIAVLSFAFLMFIIINAIGDNFHEVIAQKVYRSANLAPDKLLYVIDKYKLKSIVNLEGEQPDRPWYNSEMSVVKLTGINHFDVQLPPHGLPEDQQLKKLIYILQNAPQPLLIHCKHGSDRTGLASAISMILSENNGYNDFDEQISWKYGVVSPSSVGFEVFTNYTDWLKSQRLPNSRENFLKWANTEFSSSTTRYGWVFT
jgi:undecaprenyl-diphosphatase